MIPHICLSMYKNIQNMKILLASIFLFLLNSRGLGLGCVHHSLWKLNSPPRFFLYAPGNIWARFRKSTIFHMCPVFPSGTDLILESSTDDSKPLLKNFRFHGLNFPEASTPAYHSISLKTSFLSCQVG